MAGKPRIYLFYGSDTRASLLAIQRWRTIFEQKYGAHASFCIEADELDAAHFKQELTTAVQGETLFREARLIVIRRLTSQEKGKSRPFTDATLATLSLPAVAQDESVTIAIWEDRNLPETHPLINSFTEWQNKGVATIHCFSLPASAGLGRFVTSYLAKQNIEITSDALKWLTEQYARMEREARLEQRLKSGETWQNDTRSWWLYQLLEGAILRASGAISLENLKQGHRDLGEPVSSFEVARAISNRAWTQAKNLLSELRNQQAVAADYFGLAAAIRWQVKQSSSSKIAMYAERLLTELDIAAKNGIPDPGWLMELTVLRLEAADKGAALEPLLSLKKMWLSQLPRS